MKSIVKGRYGAAFGAGGAAAGTAAAMEAGAAWGAAAGLGDFAGYNIDVGFSHLFDRYDQKMIWHLKFFIFLDEFLFGK